MRVLDRIADIKKQAEAFVNREPPLNTPGSDIDAFHILDHQIRNAVRRGSAVNQSHDIGVSQAGHGLALEAKATDHFRIGHALTDEFDRNSPLELLLTQGEIDLTHSALPDLSD